MIGKFCRTERIVGVESPNAFFHFCFTLSLSCDKMNKTDFYKVLEAVEMKKKRIAIALGHDALGTTLPEQKEATRRAAKAIADLRWRR